MRRVVLILAGLVLAACGQKPSAKVRDLADLPPADRRVSWFHDTGTTWEWMLADASTGATIRTPLDTVTLGARSYDSEGRFAVFLTRGGVRDSSMIVDQKIFVADLESTRLWEFLAPQPSVLTAGVDADGPYFVGSTFRESPGSVRKLFARLLGSPEPCIPPVASVQRFDAGAWRVTHERSADCHAATGPASTLFAETIAQPETRSRPRPQRPESLVRQLDPEAGDGRWSYLLDDDGSGLAFLGPSAFFPPAVKTQKVRPVLSGYRPAPAVSLDGSTALVERAGGWMMVAFAQTSADVDVGVAIFEMKAGKETMRVPAGVHFPDLWVATHD